MAGHGLRCGSEGGGHTWTVWAITPHPLKTELGPDVVVVSVCDCELESCSRLQNSNRDNKDAKKHETVDGSSVELLQRVLYSTLLLRCKYKEK